MDVCLFRDDDGYQQSSSRMIDGGELSTRHDAEKGKEGSQRDLTSAMVTHAAFMKLRSDIESKK